jgi:hypothetical protein
LIDNFLNKNSITAQPGELVNLGEANFGPYPLHVKNNLISSQGHLFFLPDPNNEKVSVHWLSLPIESTHPFSIEIPSHMIEGIKQFFEDASNFVIEAANRAFQEIVNDISSQENLHGMLIDATIGIGIVSFALLAAPVGASLLVVGLSAAGAYLLGMAAGYFFDFLAKFIFHLIDMSSLSDESKETIRGLLQIITLARIGILVKKIKKDKAICKHYSELNTLTGWSISGFKPSDDTSEGAIEYIGKVFKDSTNSIISFVCEIKKKDSDLNKIP